jgi:hypothetical protein
MSGATINGCHVSIHKRFTGQSGASKRKVVSGRNLYEWYDRSTAPQGGALNGSETPSQTYLYIQGERPEVNV